MRGREAPCLLLLVGLLIWSGGAVGCATTRSVLDVRPPTAVNPAHGPAVKLVRVTDRRSFQLKPPEPSIPSLKNGEIDDPAITSRAIARKRNTYGKAMGDILLPEGRTVEQLAEEALSRGLRENGFRVLHESEPGYAQAAPLEADIYQFWAWFRTRFLEGHLEFDTRIRLTGAMEPFAEGQEFKGYVRLSIQFTTDRAWLNTINKGLENLNDDMASRLGGEAASGP